MIIIVAYGKPTPSWEMSQFSSGACLAMAQGQVFPLTWFTAFVPSGQKKMAVSSAMPSTNHTCFGLKDQHGRMEIELPHCVYIYFPWGQMAGIPLDSSQERTDSCRSQKIQAARNSSTNKRTLQRVAVAVPGCISLSCCKEAQHSCSTSSWMAAQACPWCM